MEEDRPALSARRAAELASELSANVERAIHGKSDVVRKAAACLVGGGHLLLEDLPGVGKTTLARALARSLDATFARIQFTSDLLPSDLTGGSIPELVDGRPTARLDFQPGPLFANIILADEINRASPKSQSALLEAMSERTISVDGTTHELPDPFFVVATQNPIEHYGTHPLPESQLDRFLMRLSMGYPSRDHEARVLLADPGTSALPTLEPVLSLEDLRGMQEAALLVKVDDSLVAYLLDLVEVTRNHEGLRFGASTRAALALRKAAQAWALFDARDYCIPEDIQSLAVAVLAHRVGISARGGAAQDPEEAEWILREITDRVPVPV